MLRANGTRLPVTLQLSTHDDGERVQHVVRVAPATEADRLDRQRLVLGVGEGGVVLTVNPGAPKSLFGFAPALLVGRRLSSFINVFREHVKQSGDETALLASLGVRALEGANDDAWRVGVQMPKVEGAGAAGEQAATSAFAIALQQRNRERPALMSVNARIDEDGNIVGGSGAAAAAGGDAAQQGEQASLELVLWRADSVAAIVEVDARLEITRADVAAGLLFGVSQRALVKKDFRRLAGLPPSTTPADLLAAAGAKAKAGAKGKKSGLKGGGASKVGARRALRARHVDGSELRLEMQAVTKPGSSDSLVVRLQLLEPSCGALAPLAAQLKGAVAAPVAALLADAPLAAAEDEEAAGDDEHARGAARLDGKSVAGGDDDDEGHRGGGRHGGKARVESPDEERRGGGGGGKPHGGRVADWVRQASHLHSDSGDGDGAGDGEGDDEPRGHAARGRGAKAGAGKGARSRFRDEEEGQEEEDEEEGRGAKRGAKRGARGRRGASDEDEDGRGGDAERSQSEASSGGGGGGGFGGRPPGSTGPLPGGGGGGDARLDVAGGSFTFGGASLNDGASSVASGSEAQDAASSAAGGGGDDTELVADFRCARQGGGLEGW